MKNIKSLWTMAKHVKSRLEKPMKGIESFQDIVDRIRDEANVTCFRVCAGKGPEVKNCFRPEFKLKVHKDTFDLFFNSRHGYRAQYLIDPEEGRKQNCILINALLHKLLAYAKDEQISPSMTKEQIETSLRCCSARIWISEKGSRSTPKLIKLVEEILVPEWRTHAREAKKAYNKNQYPSPLEQEKAIEGIKAPEGTVLVVIGAFLNRDDNEEVVHPEKVHRRFEINKYGFS